MIAQEPRLCYDKGTESNGGISGMSTKVLFLSDGEMGIWADGKAEMLRSARMEKYMDTARDLENRNAWKYEGASAQFQQRVNPYEARRRVAESACRITAVAAWEGQMLYGLVTPDMGGLWLRPLEGDGKVESGWISERTFLPRDMYVQGSQIVLALDTPQKECHIALMQAGKARYRVITQGDTRDTAPFLSEDGRTLYYASAGYARNEDGVILAVGPSALLTLDMQSGRLEELFADDGTDYLRPKVSPAGQLYFIRRPYQQPRVKRLTLLDRVKNFGAFFKGVGRLFQFIGDPEGAAKRQSRIAGQRDEGQQQRMLEGALVDVTRLTDASTEDSDKGCVPDTWVLMRREADGSLTEVMKGVADYGFDGEALIYTDGRKIVRLEDGRKTVLHRAVFIPRIAVVRE